MPSNSELSFHAPAAALGGVDPVGSPHSSMFSRLHLVGNSDWMSSLSSSQQVAAARPALAPPAPVASTAARPLAAPAAIDAPTSAAKGGFFSMFYRAPTAAAMPATDAAVASGASPLQLPAPPRALDALDSPLPRAIPVDAQLSLEHFSKSGVVEAAMPAIRREPPRPLALGSDTWNALSSVPLPPKASSVASKHVLSPPTAVDGVANRAPKPLWSDLSFTSRFRSSAPTLDAFRNAAPAPISSSPVESPLPSAAPVPPKPVTTSPLRDPASSSLEAVRPVAVHRRDLKTHPLVPVGEVALPLSPMLSPVPEKAESVATTAAAAAAAPVVAQRDGAVSPVLGDFVKSVAEPAAQQEEREEALAAANVRNFLSTLFSRDDDAGTEAVGKSDAFNALELAINRGSTQTKPVQPLGYNTFASNPLFMDNNDEDSEESLERLRRVVSIVMQSAKAHDGSGSQPSSQTQRRSSSTATSGKYTEFSASYHSPTSGENDWMQYARF